MNTDVKRNTVVNCERRIDSNVRTITGIDHALEHLHIPVMDYAENILAGMVSTLELLREKLLNECEARASQMGWLVATYDIAPAVKSMDGDGFVQLAGNSMVPPLRNIDEFEFLWQLDLLHIDPVSAFTDRLEDTLGRSNIYIGSHEDDNDLIAVDLNRWMMTEDGGWVRHIEGR